MENTVPNTDEKPTRSGAGMKAGIIIALAVVVGAVMYMKAQTPSSPVSAGTAELTAKTESPRTSDALSPAGNATTSMLPRLLDLGADKCIPCKMMAPILESLKTEYAGRMDVEFIDVWKDESAGEKYGVRMIPTQIFFDAQGKERFRHEGFYSKEDILAKCKELGFNLDTTPTAAAESAFSRLEPVTPDDRVKDGICYMCDGDVNPKTRVQMATAKGDVNFCSPHCYFIMCSSMVPPKNTHDDVKMTDWVSGAMIPAVSASYLQRPDAANRPVVLAFSDPAAATADLEANAGESFDISALQAREMSALCGFCDRAVYPVDACAVKGEGVDTLGCCTMCALGVAARLQKDIEIAAKDALTEEAIIIKTTDGVVSALAPETAMAWAGTKKDPSGKLVSTGCFKQAFFTSEDNLKKWVEAHPQATGRMISINEALAEKMKLTVDQISQACKIGECAPK